MEKRVTRRRSYTEIGNCNLGEERHQSCTLWSGCRLKCRGGGVWGGGWGGGYFGGGCSTCGKESANGAALHRMKVQISETYKEDPLFGKNRGEKKRRKLLELRLIPLREGGKKPEAPL